MAESTLSLKVTEIQAKLGTFAGWGRGAIYNDPPWTPYQQAILDDATASGLRRFYFPAPVDQSMSSYDWSFLKPQATCDFPPGAQSVPLPDDFGGFEGPLTLQTTAQTAQRWRIEWRNEGYIRQMYGNTPNQQGPPMFACPVPLKGTSLNAGQRFELLIYPAADNDYTLSFVYYINPDHLNGTTPYAYGGTPHTETILESCLAIMEERLDDASGVHAQAFQNRLAASISMDRRQKPQMIGMDRDRSDDHGWRHEGHFFPAKITYDGQSFG